MAKSDGDGWATCGEDHRHWGHHGASGLLAVHHGSDGPEVLLQKRARWSHHGGTWGIPSGARDSHETPTETALRELSEETSLDPDGLDVYATHTDDHGGWAFETVMATSTDRPAVAPANGESSKLEWVPAGQVTDKNLHPGFSETWPVLEAGLRPLVLVLDAANIVGSRADGWWRDRAGATARLISEVGERTPYGWREGALTWFPTVTVVVEGAARKVGDAPGIGVVAASGSGDDTIVDVVAGRAAWEKVLVVTADRELKSRCTALGATTAGPRWLLGQLDGSQ